MKLANQSVKDSITEESKGPLQMTTQEKINFLMKGNMGGEKVDKAPSVA